MRSFLHNRRSGARHAARGRALGFEQLERREMLSTTAATTLYVSTTGSNSNAGTSLAAPLQTLQAAYNLVQPGDTIMLRGGTYDPNVGGLGAWNKSGTAGAPITIEPYDHENVVWDYSQQFHWTQTSLYGGCWMTTLPANSFIASASGIRVIGADGYFATPTYGGLTAVASTPVNAGSGYQVGDVLTVVDSYGGSGHATVTVTGVGSGGGVTAVALASSGQDGYTAGLQRNGQGWNTQAVTGSGSGCTLFINSVTPLTFANPMAVGGLTDAAGNLLHDIYYYDPGTYTMYFKPAAALTDPDQQLRLINGNSQLDFTASYVTIKGIDTQYALDGIHVNSAYHILLEGNQYHSVVQGILFDGTDSTIENNYVDKVGGALKWVAADDTYLPGTLSHGLYIEGSQMTICGNFFGQSGSGMGIQALGLDDSLLDDNITYDNSYEGMLLWGNNDVVTQQIAIMENIGINLYADSANDVIENSYLEAEFPLFVEAGGSGTVGPFVIQDNAINTLTGGRSLDLIGNVQLSGMVVDGNLWLGDTLWWLAASGFPVIVTQDHQVFVNQVAQQFGLNWEQSFQTAGELGNFNTTALNAALDNSLNWAAAENAVRTYVAGQVSAAGGTNLGIPQAAGQTYDYQAGTPLSIPAGQGLLAGMSNFGAATAVASLADGAANGTVTVNPDGSFTYAPDSGFVGTDSFVYQVEDSDGNIAAATVTLVNLPPVFSGLSSQTITYGEPTTTLAGTILAGSLEPTGDVTITIDGLSASAAIDPATGGFTCSFDTHALPVAASPYAITYSYAGDTDLNPASNASTTLTVQPAVLVPSVTIADKLYDGTTAATIAGSTLAGLLNGDNVTLNGVAAFADPNAGNAKLVTISGMSLSGPDAADYVLSTTTATATADIAPAPLTIYADDTWWLAGTEQPAFNITITGFQDGQTLATSGVSGSPDFTLSNAAAGPADAGAADSSMAAPAPPAPAPTAETIMPSQGTLTASNYVFSSFMPGTLTIAPSSTLGDVNMTQPATLSAIGSTTNPLLVNNVNNGGFDLTFAGSAEVTGSLTGSGGLIVSGAGQVLLTGNDTYAGGTTVTSGTLVISGSDGLPAGTNLTIGSPAAFTAAANAAPPATAPTTAAVDLSVVSAPVTPSAGTTVSIIPTAASAPVVANRPATTTVTNLPATSAPVAVSAGPWPLPATIGPPALVSHPWYKVIPAIHDAAFQTAFVRHFAADLTWLEATPNGTTSVSQDARQDLSLAALDAAMAAYGRR